MRAHSMSSCLCRLSDFASSVCEISIRQWSKRVGSCTDRIQEPRPTSRLELCVGRATAARERDSMRNGSVREF